MEKTILHIDVNNAFLSWTALELLKNGSKEDIRKTISVIGGDEKNRSGIVLAKSDKAKRVGIKTGETLYEARKKCLNVSVYAPTSKEYKEYSKELYNILSQYSDKIERFSIDECFLDITNSKMGRTIEVISKEIQDRVEKELGFTVNIGISDCKVLAKMASDFSKPNKMHTLYQNEITYKMWNLHISELFMVGKQTVPKLLNMQIKTIGDLANRDKQDMVKLFGKHGARMWEYANGIDYSNVEEKEAKNKSISKEITLPINISDINVLEEKVFELVENVAITLRKECLVANTVAIVIKTSNFVNISHQQKLITKTNTTKEIYDVAKNILKEMLEKKLDVRLIGVRLSDLEKEENIQEQLCFFDNVKNEKEEEIDRVMDSLKSKFGDKIIRRAKIISK